VPNYVRNEVRFYGTEETLKEIQKVCNNMDFDKIMPMPETLNIISGRTAELSSICYLLFTNNITDMDDEKVAQAKDFIEGFPINGTVSESSPFGERSKDISYLYSDSPNNPKCQADVLALGEIVENNKVLYGTTDWYYWRINNWGTKWNPDDCEMVYPDENESLTYYFETPWSMPFGIMTKILEKCKSLEFSMTWAFADEDIGNNCGRFRKDIDDHNVDDIVMDHEDDTRFALNLWGFPEDYYDYDEEEDEVP